MRLPRIPLFDLTARRLRPQDVLVAREAQASEELRLKTFEISKQRKKK